MASSGLWSCEINFEVSFFTYMPDVSVLRDLSLAPYGVLSSRGLSTTAQASRDTTISAEWHFLRGRERKLPGQLRATLRTGTVSLLPRSVVRAVTGSTQTQELRTELLLSMEG